MALILTLIASGLFSLGTAWLGYCAGKFHRGWREKQAEAAADKAGQDARRLRYERAVAFDADVRPLWEAYEAARPSARQAFEDDCTSPPFMIRMATNNDYPHFHIFKRRVSETYVDGITYMHDPDGHGGRHLYTAAPPSEPSFSVTYNRIAPELPFITAAEAERWLEIALHPQDTAWGYNESGRALGSVPPALLRPVTYDA